MQSHNPRQYSSGADGRVSGAGDPSNYHSRNPATEVEYHESPSPVDSQYSYPPVPPLHSQHPSLVNPYPAARDPGTQMHHHHQRASTGEYGSQRQYSQHDSQIPSASSSGLYTSSSQAHAAAPYRSAPSSHSHGSSPYYRGGQGAPHHSHSHSHPPPSSSSSSSSSLGPPFPPLSIGSIPSGFHHPASPDKPHQCPLCYTAFARMHDLRRHMDTHTAAKPHACPTPGCGKCFTRKDALKRHMQIKKCGLDDDEVEEGKASSSSSSVRSDPNSPNRPF